MQLPLKSPLDRDSNQRDSFIWVLSLLVLLGVAVLYRPPYNAANLDTTPDSVEYVVGAERLLNLGTYDLSVAGNEYPPRYPIFFSALFVLPVLWISGANLGAPIIGVLFCGILCVILSFCMGRKIGGISGGSAAAIALLANPTIRFWGKQIMSDIPFLTLVLLTAWICLRIAEENELRMRTATVLSIVIALAFSFRPVGAALLGPCFLLACWKAESGKKWFQWLFVLGLPIACVQCLIWIYNYQVFGSMSRNGYEFWVPIPYDYPDLLFSISYIPANIKSFLGPGFGEPLLFALLIGWAFSRGKQTYKIWTDHLKRPEILLLIFLMAGPIWITALHMIYPFSEGRFHMPTTALLAVLAGGIWGKVLPFSKIWILSGLSILVVIASYFRFTLPYQEPVNYLEAKQLDTLTPEDAVIITSGQLVYLEHYVVRGTERQLIPFSRAYEYAGKIIAEKKIQNPQPPPVFFGDHMSPGLLNGGGYFSVKTVLSENPGLLDGMEDKHIFLHIGGLVERDRPLLEKLKGEYSWKEIYPNILERIQ